MCVSVYVCTYIHMLILDSSKSGFDGMQISYLPSVFQVSSVENKMVSMYCFMNKAKLMRLFL